MLKLSHHDKTLHYGFCTELMVITPRPPPRSYWIFICSGRESLWSSLYPKNRNNNSFKIAYLQISVKNWRKFWRYCVKFYRCSCGDVKHPSQKFLWSLGVKLNILNIFQVNVTVCVRIILKMIYTDICSAFMMLNQFFWWTKKMYFFSSDKLMRCNWTVRFKSWRHWDLNLIYTWKYTI